jgi:putative ABC transport system permease protein
MRSIRAFLIRLGGCLWRTRREQELNDEIDSHLQLHIDDNIRAGMIPDEARRQAVLKLGSVEATKEAMRDRQSLPWLEHLAQDVRFAFRSLRKSPGFTTVAVLTLALCIGANSAVFSVVHSILLKPYPWPESERLVQIFNSFARLGGQGPTLSPADYLDRRKGVTSLEESALISYTSFTLSATDVAPEKISGLRVTPSFFPLLKARPAIGRTFTEAEAEKGAPNTVVLSDAFWRSHFGADPKIIGTDIRLGGEPHTVIGVMPPTFYYTDRFAGPQNKLWAPHAFSDNQKSDGYLGGRGHYMIGRLRPGATLAQAQSEIDARQKAIEDRLPEFKQKWEASGFRGMVAGFHEMNVRDVRTLLWLLQGAVAAVLLIGCVNVASLLLARASARERELAIRAALGAGRGRLIRHLLTESVLLFVAGGLLGLVVALWGIGAANSLGIAKLPRSFGVSLDYAVAGFTLLCAVVTGLAFGALPAWSATRGDNANALKDAGARATTARRHLSLRSTLVVTEIALALMLVSTAALLIKSFRRVQEVSPGFAREDVLVGHFDLPAAKRETAEQLNLFEHRLLERVRALPGVVSAACANILPVSADFTFGFEVDGYTPPSGQPGPQAVVRMVSPDYFTTLGIPLLRGRVFTHQNTRVNGDVTVIDKVLADRYWPGENPIGKRLIYSSRPVPNSTRWEKRKWEIIGVVAPVKNKSLEDSEPKNTIYISTLQATYPQTFEVAVRTGGTPLQLTAALRAAVLAVDSETPLTNIQTMESIVQASMEGRRAPMILLALFAGLSLLLAALGVYGVLAFAVGQRTQEIGVRMALGATTPNIVQMILRQGAGLVGLGLMLGLGGYFALSTVIRKLLFSVETTDFAALLVAPATLALVALAACLIPARRATKVDPMVALRAE